MLRLNDIIENVGSYLPLTTQQVEEINKAYVYCAKVHAGQTRSSGEPYLSHPMEVAGILVKMKLGVPSVITALLHDTVEDTLTTLDDIEKMFGEEVMFLVDGVTKISKLPMSSTLKEQAESFRKLILATAKDIRVVLVKLADRLHNMRTLEHLSDERKKRISRETLDIYAPLAHRLGIYWMRTELEDLSFKYLYPDDYEKISNMIAGKSEEWDKYVSEVEKILHEKLMEFNVDAKITGRLKHIYSIYTKLKSQNIDPDQLNDVIAFRIVTEELKDCYAILGAVHSTWKPLPGSFKDYVALPKSNGYQSLHTCVIGPFGERMEVQIRTSGMHEIAEYGIAAHWKYKEGDLDTDDNHQVYANLRKLLEWKDVTDPTEFLEAIKGELLPDDIVYVFTPKGDLKELPQGATPVDFAYSIHTEVGNKCTRAIVNGHIVTLDSELTSGNIVEIITSNDRAPNRDWLKFVVSSRAKTRIRSWLRTEERVQAKSMGKIIAERKFKKYGVDLQKMHKKGEFDNFFNQYHIKDIDEFYMSVGYGKISVADLLKSVLPSDSSAQSKEKESRIQKIVKSFKGKAEDAIIVKDYDNVLVRLANCCSPLPGEPVAGFITRGRGITIHRINCTELLHVDPNRKIDIDWDMSSKTKRVARIVVTCADRPGMLSSISNSIAASEVNIAMAEIKSTDDAKALGTFDVTVSDLAELENVIKSIKKVKGVISVERLTGYTG